MNSSTLPVFTRCIKVFWKSTFNFQLFHMAEIGERFNGSLPSTTSCWKCSAIRRMPASTLRGRSKTVTVLDEDGHLAKKRARVSREGWDVFLENHTRRPYISRGNLGEEPRQDFWERINDATDGQAALRRNGRGLMTGLLPVSPLWSQAAHHVSRRPESVMSAEAAVRSWPHWKSGVLPAFFRQTCRGAAEAELIFEAIGPTITLTPRTRRSREQLADRRQQPPGG